VTANFEGTRRYAGYPKQQLFDACVDALQSAGFTVVQADPGAGRFEATVPESQWTGRTDTGFFEAVGVAMSKAVGFLDRFGERMTVTVSDTGHVHAVSVSQPRTVVFDEGRNKQYVLALWKALDRNLSRPREPTVRIDNSVNISGNSGPVQNASPFARQHADGGTREPGSDELAQISSRLCEILALIDQLELDPAEAGQLRADIATVHAQVEAPKPRLHVIREGLQSIRATLENAAGGALTAGFLEFIQHVHL
jgi:hypothetical protein